MTENQTVHDLLTRRSVRAYQKRQVDEDALAQIIEAARYAPTAMGRQDVHLVVLQDPAEIANLSRMNAAVMGADTDPFYGAPTVVVVLADATFGPAVCDGSLALGNMMNAAHALGVASCWIHRSKEEFDGAEGKALLTKWGVPEGNWLGVGHCILGYAEGPEPQAKPRKPGFVTRV